MPSLINPPTYYAVSSATLQSPVRSTFPAMEVDGPTNALPSSSHLPPFVARRPVSPALRNPPPSSYEASTPLPYIEDSRDPSVGDILGESREHSPPRGRSLLLNSLASLLSTASSAENLPAHASTSALPIYTSPSSSSARILDDSPRRGPAAGGRAAAAAAEHIGSTFRPRPRSIDHTVLTLAQRRRSSLGLGALAGSRDPTFIRGPTGPSGRSTDPTLVRIPPSPGLETGDDSMLGVKNMSLQRRHSTALGLVDGSESAYQKTSCGTRRIRRVVLKTFAFLLLGFLLAKGIIKTYPSVDLFSSFDLEAIPGLDALSDVAKPWTSFLPKKKPVAWEAEREEKEKEKEKEREREEEERVREEEERKQAEVDQEREHARSSAVTFRERELWAAPTSERLSTMVVGEKKGSVHEETVIFLHGLGQYSRDLPVAGQFGKRFPTVRWVMPQAPWRQVTVRKNASVSGWFNMKAFPYVNAKDENPEDLYDSVRHINSVIVEERSVLIRGLRARGGMDSLPEKDRINSHGEEDVPDGLVGTRAERKWASSRIVLGGFSQGSVMTLLTGLTCRDRLAGLVVLSGFMPLRAQIPGLVADLDRTTLPLFWGHGQADPYLLHDDAVVSLDLLKATTPSASGQGGVGLTNVEFHSYPKMDHTWNSAEMAHLGTWLEDILPSQHAKREAKEAEARGLQKVPRAA